MDKKQHQQGSGKAEEGCSSLESTGAEDGGIVPAADTLQITRLFLSGAGVRILDVDILAQNPMEEMLVKAFDPEKGNKIFLDSDESVVSLMNMVQRVVFRSVVYRLAGEHPNCLLVKKSLRCMLESGYKDEVNAFMTAVRQTNKFLNVLNRVTATNFNQEANSELFVLLHNKEFMYVYSMVLMQEVARNSSLGKMMKQSIKFIKSGFDRNLDMKPLLSVFSECSRYPSVYKALSSMVSSNALNYIDVMELYTSCNSLNRPQREDLMRNPQLIDLLIDALFKVDGAQYTCPEKEIIYLLGYVTSAPNERKRMTKQIEIMYAILKEWPKQQEEERVRIAKRIHESIHCPVIGACVLRWIEDLVAEPHYFSRCSPANVIMGLVDMLSIHHPPLRGRILHMVIRLFEGIRKKTNSKEMKEMLFDRLMCLLEHGYANAETYVSLSYRRGDIIKPFL